MAEISMGGLWIRWSSLTAKDKRDLVLCWSLSLIGGAATGFLSDMFDSRPGMLRELALLPIVPFLGAMVYWQRFLGRQDEMFRMMDAVALRVGVVFSGGAALSMTLLQEVANREPKPMLILLLLFAVGYCAGWMVAARRYT